MATITFDGPNPANPSQRAVTVVTMTDEALLAAVEAVCMSEGYVGDSPGLFVIQKTVNGWVHATELYQKNKAYAEADAAVATALEPLRQIEYSNSLE